MKHNQHPRREISGGVAVLPALVLGTGLLAVAVWSDWDVSGYEVRDKIYERYGDCLEPLGHLAVNYSAGEERAELTPTDLPDEDALIFKVPLNFSRQPLPEPEYETGKWLSEQGCATPESFWGE